MPSNLFESGAAAAAFILWHRARAPRARWQAVFRAATSAECTAQIGVVRPAGDWITMPEGQDPNKKAKVR